LRGGNVTGLGTAIKSGSLLGDSHQIVFLRRHLARNSYMAALTTGA
jgi:hypothetical protein